VPNKVKVENGISEQNSCQPLFSWFIWQQWNLIYIQYAFLKIIPIRALSAHSAAEFNISPGRWQQVWLVAIVPPNRWGKMDRNDCHTAWGNFKTLISLRHHNKNYAWFFSLFVFFQKLLLLLSFRLSIAIYRLQVTTFLTLAWVAIYTADHEEMLHDVLAERIYNDFCN
jgi:hypothetical protein